jgi:hypothetical protein
MASFVKVLQIESIIPYLLESGPVEHRVANLELDDEDYRADEEHRVNSPPHARDAELHEDPTVQANGVSLQEGDLLQPGVPLGRQNGIIAVCCQPAEDGVRACLEEFSDRGRIPGPC